ncbi:hypothetical protein TNCV_3178681 [Trichonephila clavipes]|uniref:Uncharacterized protein n=1 Tax=Trichonephila clavipes TaxID=2585209 RepID=A0A8X6RGB2_TRICX|nr:hypothetical protein TNCV_3178681 [Trichonephila clavipes]
MKSNSFTGSVELSCKFTTRLTTVLINGRLNEEPSSEERPGEDLKWLKKEYDRVANFNKWDDMMCLANVYFFLTELRDSGMSTNEDALGSPGKRLKMD